MCAVVRTVADDLETWFFGNTNLKQLLVAKINQKCDFLFFSPFFDEISTRTLENASKYHAFSCFFRVFFVKTLIKNTLKIKNFQKCLILATRSCLKCMLAKNHGKSPLGDIWTTAHTFFYIQILGVRKITIFHDFQWIFMIFHFFKDFLNFQMIPKRFWHRWG